MNQLVRFGLILGVICLAATLVLAVTYEVTKPRIEEQLKREESEALKTIMPEADTFTPKTLDGSSYFEAFRDGRLTGYCLKVTAMGYGGYIRLIVGIDPDGIIKGVSILEHQETPGLGAEISEVKAHDDRPWFLEQFAGKDAKVMALGKDIDAISGATISSAAVTDSVRDAVTKFLERIRQ